MTLMSGSLTGRRYRVGGEPPDDFRTMYADHLAAHAFREPLGIQKSEEIEGWVLIQNLLDTDFGAQERWLFNHYLAAALRVDKKTLPAKLFRAHLDKRVAAWCQEQKRERAPASVRTEIKELLEDEMYARTLPRVALFEFCWNIAEGWVVFMNTSDGPNDRFRKRFRETFGLSLLPFSPLEFLDDVPEIASILEVQGMSDLRAGGWDGGSP